MAVPAAPGRAPALAGAGQMPPAVARIFERIDRMERLEPVLGVKQQKHAGAAMRLAPLLLSDSQAALRPPARDEEEAYYRSHRPRRHHGAGGSGCAPHSLPRRKMPSPGHEDTPSTSSASMPRIPPMPPSAPVQGGDLAPGEAMATLAHPAALVRVPKPPAVQRMTPPRPPVPPQPGGQQPRPSWTGGAAAASAAPSPPPCVQLRPSADLAPGIYNAPVVPGFQYLGGAKRGRRRPRGRHRSAYDRSPAPHDGALGSALSTPPPHRHVENAGAGREPSPPGCRGSQGAGKPPAPEPAGAPPRHGAGGATEVLVSVYEGIAARHFQAARARPVAEGEEASRHQKKDEEAAAALKIQAAVRGANARRDLWEEREEAAQDVMRRFFGLKLDEADWIVNPVGVAEAPVVADLSRLRRQTQDALLQGCSDGTLNKALVELSEARDSSKEAWGVEEAPLGGEQDIKAVAWNLVAGWFEKALGEVPPTATQQPGTPPAVAAEQSKQDELSRDEVDCETSVSRELAEEIVGEGLLSFLEDLPGGGERFLEEQATKEVDAAGLASPEQAAAEASAAEQAAAEQAAVEQTAAELAAKDAAELAAAKKAAKQAVNKKAEQGAAEQAAAEQAAVEQAAADLAAAELAAAEQAAAEAAKNKVAEQAAAEQETAEQATAAQTAADQTAVEQAIADKAAAEHVAAQQAALEKAAADRAAAEQAASEAPARPQARALEAFPEYLREHLVTTPASAWEALYAHFRKDI